MSRMNVDERRARLVDAAIAVMLRDGVARTTTRAIVTEAGMTTGAFHYSFFSKEELELEVMRVLNTEALEGVLERSEADARPADLIDRVVSAYVSGLVADSRRRQLAFELTLHALRQPGLKDAAVEHYRGKLARTEAFLQRIADTGSFTWRMSIEPLARLALSTAEGTTYTWLVTGEATATDELHDALAGFLSSMVADNNTVGVV